MSRDEFGTFSQTSIVEALRDCGADPIILPHSTDDETLWRYVRLCDGFLMPGGSDIDPALYGEDPIGERVAIDPSLYAESPGCERIIVDPLQDSFEFALLPLAIEAHRPVLGICRGCQAINVTLGGTLWQDIPSQVQSDLPEESRVAHSHRTPEGVAAHTVRVAEGSLLAGIVGEAQALPVTSTHHQCVHEVAPAMVASAWAPDGIVEAIEPRQGDALAGDFVLGVQWHPERLWHSFEEHRALFQSLVDAAASRMVACGERGL